jgi:hypothetical protein
MKDLHNLPTKHKEFNAMMKALTEKQIKKDRSYLNLLNRFMYRYRMAKAFQTIVAPDVGKITIDGYACGMKLFMAYSAYDEIRAAERILLGKGRNNIHKRKDAALAEKIRANKEMEDLLLNSITINDDGLRKILINFYESKNDEIMFFASCLRHSFVHGDFTAARAGLTNKTKIGVVNEVTNMVLKVSDDIFSEMLS